MHSHFDPDCVFCAIVERRAPAFIVDEGHLTLAFLDAAPLTPGHTLVIPKSHTENLLSCPADGLTAVALAAQRVAGAALAAFEADGVNLVQANGAAAWQTVFHFHIHVLPRYRDDALLFPFRRTLGDPAGLDQHAEVLRATLGTPAEVDNANAGGRN